MATQRFRLHRAVGARLRDAAASGGRCSSCSTTCTAPTRRRWPCSSTSSPSWPTSRCSCSAPTGRRRSPSRSLPRWRPARHEPLRVDLAGLDDADASELVRRVAAADLDPHVVDAIVARTDGNPFYVRESARLAGAGGDLGDAAAPSRTASAT